MGRGVATGAYLLVILGLFLLDRDREKRVSPTLWIPVAWLLISASRSVSEWLGASASMESPDQYLAGSPLDAAVYLGLEIAALLILVRRRARVGPVLRANWPLLLFFFYCALGVLWSEFPDVAFKRWFKATGNLVMVLVVLTDPDPLTAVKRFFSRVAFLLVPLSVLFIKYYPELGRSFDSWSGQAINTGVTTNKNSLGIICLIAGLGSLWQALATVRQPRRWTGSTLAHFGVLLMVAWLFGVANSATSLGCFLAGGALLVLAKFRSFKGRPIVVHIVTAVTVFAAVFGVLVNRSAGVVQAFGRDSTLTTRQELWDGLRESAVDPVFGAGFESFWLGERARVLWEKYWWHPNQAHNGYLEFYLNLGWSGVVVLFFVMIWGYQQAAGALRRDSQLGALRVALLIAAVLYNLTEAAFKAVHPVWIVFLLAVTVAPTRVAALSASSAGEPSSRIGASLQAFAMGRLVPAGKEPGKC